MFPTVDATPYLLYLWESLTEPDGQATPLFQFVDGHQGWLVGDGHSDSTMPHASHTHHLTINPSAMPDRLMVTQRTRELQ